MRAVIEPKDTLGKWGAVKGQISGGDVKKTCVLCFSDVLLEKAAKALRAKYTGKFVAQNRLYSSKKVSVISTGIGSPSTALIAEKMIAAGGRKFVCIGFCGSLSEKLRVGDVLLANEAERGEGLSHNYLKRDVRVNANAKMAKTAKHALEKRGIKHVTGKVWTTDAIYRETRGKIDTFKRKGCIGVDMETAGIYAVARYRKVKACALLITTDELFGQGWKNGGSNAEKTTKMLCGVLGDMIN